MVTVEDEYFERAMRYEVDHQYVEVHSLHGLRKKGSRGVPLPPWICSFILSSTLSGIYPCRAFKFLTTFYPFEYSFNPLSTKGLALKGAF